jgi:hypothetical protein
MDTTRLAESLTAVALFMVIAWVIAGALGYHFVLWSSLALSLGFTLALNVLAGFRVRPRQLSAGMPICRVADHHSGGRIQRSQRL